MARFILALILAFTTTTYAGDPEENYRNYRLGWRCPSVDCPAPLHLCVGRPCCCGVCKLDDVWFIESQPPLNERAYRCGLCSFIEYEWEWEARGWKGAVSVPSFLDIYYHGLHAGK